MNTKQVFGACCLCKSDDGIWFVHDTMSVLLFYSFKEEKITFYKVIPCKEIIQIASFGACVYADGYIWLFSNNQTKSFRYDVNRDCFEELEIDNLCRNTFRGAVILNKDIYVIPYKYDRIIKISIENSSIQYICNWKKVFGANEDEYINSYSFDGKHKLAMVVPGHHKYMLFDFETSKMSVINSSNLSADYTQICLWSDIVIVFDRSNEKLELMNLFGDIIKNKSKRTNSAKLTSFGEYFIFDNNNSDELCIYSRELEKEQVYTLKNNKSCLRIGFNIILDWINDIKNNCFGISNANELIFIDKSLNMQLKELKMNEHLLNNFIKEIIESNDEVLLENEMIGLTQFINSI